MSYLEVSAHMTVRPGCLHGLREQMAECIRIRKEKDTRTLRYDWSLGSDGTECEVRETYSSPDGLIERNTHILEARIKLFRLRGQALHDLLWRIIADAAGPAEKSTTSGTNGCLLPRA